MNARATAQLLLNLFVPYLFFFFFFRSQRRRSLHTRPRVSVSAGIRCYAATALLLLLRQRRRQAVVIRSLTLVVNIQPCQRPRRNARCGAVKSPRRL